MMYNLHSSHCFPFALAMAFIPAAFVFLFLSAYLLLSVDLNKLHHLPPNFIVLLLDSPSQPSFRRQ